MSRRQIQRKPQPDTPQLAASPAVVQAALSSGGQALDQAARTSLEPQFGYDFSQVQVFATPEAAQSAEALDAQAYTVGANLVFGAGRYAPQREDGRWLIAHELAHVVQQSSNPPLAPPAADQIPISPPDDAMEQEADAAADAALMPAARTAAPAGAQGTGTALPLIQRRALFEAVPIIQRRTNDDLPPAEAEPAMAALELPAPPELVLELPAPLEEAAPTEVPAETPTSPPTSGPEVTPAAVPAPEPAAPPPAAPVGEAPPAAAPPTEPPAAALEPEPVPGGPAVPAEVETPASAEADPAFQAVVNQARGAADNQRRHQPAQQAAASASAAATMPPEERMGRAQTTQVGAMDQAAELQQQAAAGGQAPGFDKEAFKSAIRQRIKAMTPSDPREMENFGSSNNLDEVREGVGTNVQQGKEQARGQVDDTAAAPPDPSVVPERQTTPLTPNEAGAPPSINAGAAVPPPRSRAALETPLQQASNQVDQQMEQADVTEEQLANSNEPAFQGALAQKNEAQAAAEQAGPSYRTQEQSHLTQAAADTAAFGAEQVQGMNEQRAGVLGQVDTLQTTTVSADEQKRAEIGRQVEAIYNETRTQVEARLARLDSDVDAAFTRGAEAAKAAFVEYTDRETTRYKDERYSFSLEGAGNLLGDTFTGMPEEYFQIYAAGRDLYIEQMDVALDEIAGIVGTALTEARQIVADGRTRITEFVNTQPEELRGVAQEAADSIQTRFDELEQQVDSKRDSLIDSLAQRYTENLQALDAEIEQVRQENSGLINRALDAIGGVINTIMQLKDMLLNTISRAADAVSLILRDPIGFVGNLISAVRGGLENFVGNALQHLQNGFIAWLTGEMSGAGIQIPENLDLMGILDLALQVLGLTYDNIRARAVGVFGEGVVSALETMLDVVNILREQGLPGLWEWIQDQFDNLYGMVIDGIIDMLRSEVIEAGIKWLVGILGGPAGAFIKACMAIYDIVMWFINNAQRLAALVNAVVDSVVSIASGNLGEAMQFVEDALARAVPVAIGFLASLLGLGDLAAKVRRIIDRVQAPVNRALDKIFGMIRGFVQKVAKLLGFGEGGGAGGDGEIGEEVAFSADDEDHKLWVEVRGDDAELVMASEKKSLVDHVAEWQTKVSNLKGPKQAEAKSLLDQVQAKAGTTNTKAKKAAKAKTSKLKLEDGDSILRDDQEVEQEQQQLVDLVKQLLILMYKDAEQLVDEDKLRGSLARKNFGFSRETKEVLGKEADDGQQIAHIVAFDVMKQELITTLRGKKLVDASLILEQRGRNIGDVSQEGICETAQEYVQELYDAPENLRPESLKDTENQSLGSSMRWDRTRMDAALESGDEQEFNAQLQAYQEHAVDTRESKETPKFHPLVDSFVEQKRAEFRKRWKSAKVDPSEFSTK